MSKSTILVASVLLVFSSAAAMARDDVLHLPFAEVLSMPEAKAKLDGSVSFFLAGAETPRVMKRLGEGVSNRKTNGFGKADAEACRWAALSALVAFQVSAKRAGANVVVKLVSYYKKNLFESSTEYECHAGGVIVGVAFKGEYATVGQ